MSDALLLPCYYSSSRQATRAMGQFYAEALRPAGIESAQFGLCMVIRMMPGVTSGEIGRRMIMDKTTLTRTLRLMQENGLVEWAPGSDRREKHWRLTPEGDARYAQAYPLWENAQRELRRQFGKDMLAAWQRLSYDLASGLAEGAGSGGGSVAA